MKKIICTAAFLSLFIACKNQEKENSLEEKPTTEVAVKETKEVSAEKNEKENHQLRSVSKAKTPPIIDGKANDSVWSNLEWYQLDQNWVGNEYTPNDFQGKYKITWDEEAIYILAEIQDDVLIDQYDDPFKAWWDDDCVEIFIDEDNSGGEHQYGHNAFAYHVALDGNVVDFGPDKKPHLYNDHVKSAHKTEGNTTIWELKVKIYPDTYQDENNSIEPLKLTAGKSVGFALAYCDNDNSKERENFIGSVYVPGENKNQGWINADIFGTLHLEE
jgi:hypothetical protein